MSFDTDLIAYYDAEARADVRVAVAELRLDLRKRFGELITAEAVVDLLDVGCGPGLDTVAWNAAGFRVIGLDLATANASRVREQGLMAVSGTLYDLPFRDASFDALWTMSTFVHVPHDRFDHAMRELLRVVRPGAAIGIGTWGGHDFEGVPEFGAIRPYRFFSLASHDRWRAMLARHADVEVFESFEATSDHGWEYQYAVVRAPEKA